MLSPHNDEAAPARRCRSDIVGHAVAPCGRVVYAAIRIDDLLRIELLRQLHQLFEVAEQHGHLRALEYARAFGNDARIPACVERIISEGSAVISRWLVASAAYWGEVHRALSKIKGTRLSALDGFTEEETARCLEKNTILQCAAGDRLLKKGGVARNLFVWSGRVRRTCTRPPAGSACSASAKPPCAS